MSSVKLLLAQIGVIVCVARVLGWLLRKLHQPRVVGEMLAGVLLGPSLLGWVAPQVSAALFPAESLGGLQALSQLGLLLFMFLIGLELDVSQLRVLGRAAAFTSVASLLVPGVCGGLLAVFLYPRLAEPGVPFTSFALFLATAISVTAFPVLARILAEQGLLQSRIGALALTCAAVNDAAAWCMLAGIVVLVRANEQDLPVWLRLLGLGAYVLVMFVPVRRLLQRLARRFQKQEGLTHELLAAFLLIVLLSSWVTEALGVHALFGAFLAGLVMPRHPELERALWLRIESVVVVLLLPLYFVLTGLRTSLSLLDGAAWWLVVVIVATAVAGKLGGSMLAARAGGLAWREAAAVGVLMNTHGMVELVILNVGLDLGLISPRLFALMVVMALTTTLMAAPLLRMVYRGEKSEWE